jgi:hypothetical protein
MAISLQDESVARAPAAQPGARRRLDPERAAPLVFAALALIAFAFLMWDERGNTFFFDEWTWIFTRYTGLHSILTPYNQQMFIAPTAIYQLLFHTIGLRRYWVYRLLGTTAHVALACMAFIYVRRRVGAAAVLILAPFLFLGNGWEDVIWPVDAGFPTALALAIGALLALDGRRRHRETLACALLVASLAFSELALVFALGIAVELTWQDRSLRRAYVWAVPVALYGCWWLGYYQPSNLGSGLTGMPDFAANMAAGAIGGLMGLDINWGMPLILAAIGFAYFRFSRPGAFSPRAFALLVAACAYWLLVAFGRDADPNAPRYVYIGSLLLILIAAEALRGTRASPRALVLGLLVSVFALLGNLHAFKAATRELRTGSQIARADLGALDLARTFVPPTDVFDSQTMPGMTAGLYFAATDALGSTPADSPAQILNEPEAAREHADSVLVNAGELPVGPGPAAIGPAATAPAVEAAIGGTVARHGACVTFTPAGTPNALRLELSTAGLQLHAAPGAAVPIYAQRFAADFGATQLTTLAGGKSLVIHRRADGFARPWSLQLSPSQPVAVCPA